MEVDNSPVRDELPAHNSAENSLPGGDTNASKTVLDMLKSLRSGEISILLQYIFKSYGFFHYLKR